MPVSTSEVGRGGAVGSSSFSPLLQAELTSFEKSTKKWPLRAQA